MIVNIEDMCKVCTNVVDGKCSKWENADMSEIVKGCSEYNPTPFLSRITLDMKWELIVTGKEEYYISYVTRSISYTLRKKVNGRCRVFLNGGHIVTVDNIEKAKKYCFDHLKETVETITGFSM